jgi:hypothetical protein
MTHRMFASTARWTALVSVVALTGIALPGPVAVAAQDEQVAAPKRVAEKAQADNEHQAAERREIEKREAEKASAEKQAARQRPEAGGAERFITNIKIDVKITDQSGAGQPIVKTLSAVVGDREEGSIRTSVNVPVPIVRLEQDVVKTLGWDLIETPLNIDLRARMQDSNRVLVWVSLNYKTTFGASDEAKTRPTRTSEITQKFALFLENGKPVTVSQSADAATDRKVTIELKATILK